MIQLDALRTLAVMAVLITHFLHNTAVSRCLPWDELGVQLFFVLSGFLITRILLHGKTLSESGAQSPWYTARQFYLRRSLRIFPLFYAALIVLGLAGVGPVAETIGWHVTYTSNIYFMLIGKGHGSVTHFWTLAVEEQFYLVWPFVILLTPRRSLGPVILATILAGPAFRAVTGLMGTDYMMRKVLLIANLDTLGFGALLALWMVEGDQRPERYRRLLQAGLRVGGPLFIAFMFMHYTRAFPHGVDTVFQRSVLGLFFVWLIGSAAHGFGGPAGWLLRQPVLTSVGKISYGIYVLHNFMPEILQRVFTALQWPYPTHGSPGLRFVLLVSASVLVAAVSWHLFEKPINNLKRYFPYKKPGAEPTSS